MEFECNFASVRVNPQEWARRREDEGWDVISVADHYWMEVGWSPHVFAALGAIGAVTSRARVGTGFANNLFRHPVEFAQAALTLQEITGGRFEAGLGAGWSSDELVRTGQPYPSARERADRLIEAVRIVRAVFDGSPVSWAGEHYAVDLGGRDHVAAPPPLVVSVGGERTLRGVAPYVDRLELKVTSVANRGGVIDPGKLAAVSLDDLRRSVAAAREVRPDVPLGLFVLARARDDERTRAAAAAYPADSLVGRAWGDPAKVLERLLELEDEGLSRVHVSAVDEATYANLGALLGTRR